MNVCECVSVYVSVYIYVCEIERDSLLDGEILFDK